MAEDMLINGEDPDLQAIEKSEEEEAIFKLSE
jgi:hypothetical protein